MQLFLGCSGRLSHLVSAPTAAVERGHEERLFEVVTGFQQRNEKKRQILHIPFQMLLVCIMFYSRG